MPASKQSRSAKKAAQRAPRKSAAKSATRAAERTSTQRATTDPLALLTEIAPDFVLEQLVGTPVVARSGRATPANRTEVRRRARALNIQIDPNDTKLLGDVGRINPRARRPVSTFPEDVRESLEAVRPQTRRFHGSNSRSRFSRSARSCLLARTGSAIWRLSRSAGGRD
jgi:hypothetical protein